MRWFLNHDSSLRVLETTHVRLKSGYICETVDSTNVTVYHSSRFTHETTKINVETSPKSHMHIVPGVIIVHSDVKTVALASESQSLYQDIGSNKNFLPRITLERLTQKYLVSKDPSSHDMTETIKNAVVVRTCGTPTSNVPGVKGLTFIRHFCQRVLRQGVH